MVPASLGEKYVIRFCVCAQNATDSDIGKFFAQFFIDCFYVFLLFFKYSFNTISILIPFSSIISLEHAWNVITEFATDLKHLMEQDAIAKQETKVRHNQIQRIFSVSYKIENAFSWCLNEPSCDHLFLSYAQKDEEITKQEEENTEEVFQMVDRKNRRSLRYKRSFFVRMVSDPKIYNPKIVRSLSGKSRVRVAIDLFLIYNFMQSII